MIKPLDQTISPFFLSSIFGETRRDLFDLVAKLVIGVAQLDRINFSQLVLILKSIALEKIRDCRPINLFNNTFNIIAKTLSNILPLFQ